MNTNALFDGCQLSGERSGIAQTRNRHLPTFLAGCAAIALVVHAADARAQGAAPGNDRTGSELASDTMNADIIVTAQKKSAGERLQDVPASITALSGAQLEAMQYTSLGSLSATVPNVQLDETGFRTGGSSFVIRGQGVLSSTPSIEPTVGVYVDGVYQATGIGSSLDTFDLEAIEVLRGPQGVLLGRNSTAGAVLIRTARPDGRTGVKARATVESGLIGTGTKYSAAASVQTALVPDTLFAKLTGYYANDAGYFKSLVYPGRNTGKSENWFLRPTLVAHASDALTVTVIGEYGEQRGDAGSLSNSLRGDFRTATGNDIGFSNLDYGSITAEAVLDVGEGSLTNVFGYRDVKQLSLIDTDATPLTLIRAFEALDVKQVSNELRYATPIAGFADVVAGLYYLHSFLDYYVREFNGYAGLTADYGGRQIEDTYGAFMNVDARLGSGLTLTLGGRYSSTKKQGFVATRSFAINACNFDSRTCNYNYRDQDTFKSFTPRVALRLQAAKDINFYASYTKGYRSGGYNIRSTVRADNRPFGDEVIETYELGMKSQFLDRRFTLNVGLFQSDIDGLQRNVLTVTPLGFANVLGNFGIARTRGIEVEARAVVADGFVVFGNLGYNEGKYTTLDNDLNGDGVINAADFRLKLVELTPLTYNIGAVYDLAIPEFGKLSTTVNYNFRDRTFQDDPNLTATTKQHQLSAGISLTPDPARSLKLTIYGKNLLNTPGEAGAFPVQTLPLVGGVNRFIGKGRTFGLELAADF